MGRFTQADTHWNTANMIYGDNPQKINERQDALGLKTYSYAPQISAVMQSGNLYVYCVSNPILYTDPNGSFAKEFDQISLTEGGVYGGGTAALLLFPALITTAEELANAVIQWVKTCAGEAIYGDQSVYVLHDYSGRVHYVGRTNDPQRRINEHRHDPRHPERAQYEMKVVLTGLTIQEAKFYEQLLISSYTLQYLENARREIAAGNIWAHQKYIESIENIIEGATEDVIMDLLGR